MYEIAKSGTVRIGVTFDQPGLGQKQTGEDIPVGFDIDIARMLAAKLGIPTEKVTWVEAESEVREKYLRKGTVDFVVASYSLSDERRKVVGQAGPYYITGQRLLVLRDSRIKDVDDIRSARVCAVKGSSALQNVKRKGARVVPVTSTRDCLDRVLDGTVPAMTGDGDDPRALRRRVLQGSPRAVPVHRGHAVECRTAGALGQVVQSDARQIGRQDADPP
jgi:glutamate transport system substrate-binding protein